jgi:hypothetical protein
MPKDANLKKIVESSKSKSGFKSKKEFEEGEYVSNGCKTNDVLTVSGV